jgi:hypothetical protein
MSEPASLSEMRRQMTELQVLAAEVKQTLGGGGNGTHMPDMSERLGKLEGTVEGLKHGQTQLLVAIGIVAAFVIGFGIYGAQRFDSLNEKVNGLPGQISAELRDITKTIAESITATKQQAPQVILLPAPQQQPKSNNPQ